MSELSWNMATSTASGPASTVPLTDEQFRLISRALGDPTRHEILTTIGRCPGLTPCSTIRPEFPLSAATLSHHMKELETAGLICSQKDGKFVSYKLRRDVMQAYIQRLSEI